jgi:nucleoprotein TPR
MISFNRLLKSGMTLTQIYSQYVSISEQMLFEEEENKKLNNYIDQILQVKKYNFFCVFEN